MAKRQRRSYSDEYKRQAVDLVSSSGRSAKSVSKELELDGALHAWRPAGLACHDACSARIVGRARWADERP